MPALARHVLWLAVMKWIGSILVASSMLVSVARADNPYEPSETLPEIYHPWLTISVAGGLAQSQGDPGADALGNDLHGLLGLTVDLRRQRPNYELYASVEGYFLGGLYAGRVGGILGMHYRGGYSEILSMSTIGNTTYTTTRNTNEPVASIVGLSVSTEVVTLAGHTATLGEVGFGLQNQHLLELQLAYDFASGQVGGDLHFTYCQDHEAVVCGRLDMLVMQSFSTANVPVVMTIGFGGGPGFFRSR